MSTEHDEKESGRSLAFETITAQAHGHIDPLTRALVPALHPSTTYERDADGGYSSGRGYTRPHNPSYDEPEALLSTLEGGEDCLLFASGMAAATAVFQALLPGDHVVAPRVMYWALRTWLVDFAMSWGLEVEFVDTTDPDRLAAAMRPGKTRLVWLETPANPTWDVTDIEASARIAHAIHARVAVDSTVATPVLTRPIALGADLVVHSASKYLNGHSDVLAGAVITAREDSFWHRIRAWRRDGGAVLGPFEAWLLLRGMRTLFVRVARSSASALAVAQHFESHPGVSVLYPGLPGHPGHAIARREMSGGFGGMLSIRHRGGQTAAIETAARVRVFKRATSLGGVESLIEHRASIEGPSTTVPGDLLRLSVGLESPDDLIADLEAALARGTTASSVAAPAPATRLQEPSGDLLVRIGDLLDDKVHPIVADRGCELALQGFDDGVLTLTVAGSPGASLPISQSIENLICHYVPEVRRVRLATPPLPSDAPGRQFDSSPAAEVERLLHEEINPAVHGHGGAIRLVEVKGDTAYLEFQGRCQGCAMANVTLRQGVEVMITERVPEILAVEDLTDHSGGTDPYFKTRKGAK